MTIPPPDIDIELRYFDGIWFAECPDAPGLLGAGDEQEEAMEDLLMYLASVPWN